MASADEAPVIRLCNLIMTQGLRDRASDVHIEPQDGTSGSGSGSTAPSTTSSPCPREMGPAWSAGSRSWPT